MGGGLALAMAGFFPHRVLAAASYHGSYLAATDRPESPHLLGPAMNPTARIYVAGADEDPRSRPDMKDRLDQALGDRPASRTRSRSIWAHGTDLRRPTRRPTIRSPPSGTIRRMFELFDTALR